MKLSHGSVVAIACCLAASCPADLADASLVYGNLGAGGANTLSATSFSAMTGSNWVAQGFSVGGTNNVLQTVTLGLFDVNDATSATVRIFPSAGSGTAMSPGGSALASLTQTVSSTAPSLMAFDFGSLPLMSGSTYWVVVSATSGGEFRWASNAGNAVPLGQNSSAWQNPGDFAGIFGTVVSPNAGGNWSQSSSAQPASISITAIPEPAACLLAASGAAAAGIGLTRRNLRARRRNTA